MLHYITHYEANKHVVSATLERIQGKPKKILRVLQKEKKSTQEKIVLLF